MPYRLIGPDLREFESTSPGRLAGDRNTAVYCTLFCWKSMDPVRNPDATERVYFADEESAIAAGFRPCQRCLRSRYRIWAAGRPAGGTAYPWLISPLSPRVTPDHATP